MKRFIVEKKKNTTERVGFYVALSVCMVAVGLAVWSAYTSFGDQNSDSDHYFASLKTSPTQAVAQDMTGVTEPATQAPTQPTTTAPTEKPTEKAKRTKGFTIYDTETMPAEGDEEEAVNGELSSVEAVLRVADSLSYPVKSRSVLKQYSEDAVFSKTMRDYRAHTGCDFAADAGENVYAMCSGTVKDISVSELYGVILEVESEGFSVYYCGLSNEIIVEKGQQLKAGDTVGTVGQIPCESADDSHVHVEVRVGKKLIDPLSVIDSND